MTIEDQDMQSQIPGVSTVVDSSHATPEVTDLLVSFFTAKSAKDVDATMAFFAHHPFSYLDGTLGWEFPTWESLHDLFAKFMPYWPDHGSYPTKILGDSTSAVVIFTNIAGLFGPSEIRSISTVNFEGGKVVRWLDQWDGRHFGLKNLVEAGQSPQSKFPANWQESTVGETAAPPMKQAAHALTAAVNSGDLAAVSAILAPDVVLADDPAHLRIVGQRSVAAYLGRGVLPYAMPGADVRHVVGSASGGGYEWTNSAGKVPRGVNAVELDAQGRITELISMWDGSLATPGTLTSLAEFALED